MAEFREKKNILHEKYTSGPHGLGTKTLKNISFNTFARYVCDILSVRLKINYKTRLRLAPTELIWFLVAGYLNCGVIKHRF
jgi:hypothetical protein